MLRFDFHFSAGVSLPFPESSVGVRADAVSRRMRDIAAYWLLIHYSAQTGDFSLPATKCPNTMRRREQEFAMFHSHYRSPRGFSKAAELCRDWSSPRPLALSRWLRSAKPSARASHKLHYFGYRVYRSSSLCFAFSMPLSPRGAVAISRLCLQ